VIQSPLVLRLTFKLDTHTGKIWQLVEAPDRHLVWEQMTVLQPPSVESASPRFKIFTSAVAVRATFLIDTETGNTWTLTQSDQKGSSLSWVPTAQP
jgi:hypothetical protein